MKKRVLITASICLGLLAVCVAIPVILAWQQIPDGWGFSSGELLGYIGAVLGGMITLIGVAITIRYEHHEAREERIRASSPCLVPTLLCRGELDEVPSRFASREGTFFILRPNDTPQIKASLKEHEYQKWLDALEESIIGKGVTSIGPSSIAAFAFEIKNVGLGPAINYRIRIMPSSFDAPRPSDYAAGNSALHIDDSYCAAVYCDTNEPSAEGEYRLELTYLDLYGYRYSDSFEFEISDRGQQITFSTMVDPTRSVRPETKRG